jgi:FtsP/CotA-like multicopper oxidase with cupredoxin domain
VTLVAQATVWEVAPGESFPAWSFNGVIPGPTICLREGDTLVVTLENRLPTITSFHAHGLAREPSSDGTFLTESYAVPGGSYTYTLQADSTSVGTWAYHDAVAELDEGAFIDGLSLPESGEGIERGMFGAIIVYGEEELDADGLPVGYDHELVLVEAEFEAEVTAGPVYMTINGRIAPATPHYQFQAGETVRFRIINVGPNANHNLWVSGLDWRQTQSGEHVDSVHFGALEFGDFTLEVGEPRETRYICSIEGHEAAGMHGLFSVIE